MTCAAAGHVEQLPGGQLLLASVDSLFGWARANSLWPLSFGTKCCAIEMLMATGASHQDMSRFGAEVARNSPRQADLMIVSGRVSNKMAPVVKRLYDQMLEPKWVIAMGNCGISGGPFCFPGQYAIVEGVDKLFPREQLSGAAAGIRPDRTAPGTHQADTATP